MADAPELMALRWRVDVCISSSALSRVMRPTVLAEVTLSDGTIRTFEVSPEQFHKLRYGTAKMLREMSQLEKHPIMRLRESSRDGPSRKK